MESNNGSLSFTSGMDTTQIRADVDKVKAQFKGLGDSAKAEGVRVEEAFNAASSASTTGFQKSTTTLKEQIAQQRQIIREITGDIKTLTLTASEATNPGKKSEILGDLRGAKKALAEEQATLIGLQRQQIDANGKEADSQGGILAGLGKWAIGLASVAGAMKIGHSIMESTEATAHVLEQGIAGASAATSYFFKTIASGDWSNFFEGMNAAVSGAIEFVNAMEDIENRLNEQKIKGSEIDKEIATLRAGTFDKGRENNQQVIDNLTKIVALEKEKYTTEAKTAKDTYDETLKKVALTNKTDKEHIDNLISEYTKNKELIELGEEYNKLKGVKLVTAQAGGFSPTMGNAAEYQKAQEELKLLGSGAEAAGKIAEQFAKVTFKERNNLADLKAKAISLEGMAVNGARRDESQLAAAINKKKTDDEAIAKKKKEDAELDNRIKATRDLLKGANDSERNEIAKRLVLLEAEKKLIEWKNSSAIAMASNKPIEAKGADTALQAIRDMAKAAGIDLEKGGKLKDNDIEIDKIKKGNEARTKQAEKLGKLSKEEKDKAKGLAEEFYAVADAAGAISSAIGDGNQGLSAMLGGVASAAGQMGDLAKKGFFSSEGMSKGDSINAGLGAASSMMTMIIKQGQENKKVQDDWTNAITESVHQAALLRIESLAYKESNIFGVENPYSKAIAGANQYRASMVELGGMSRQLEGGAVQVGTKKVASGSNIAAGVVAGATIGTVLPGIGNLIGGVIGGVVGGIVGLLTKKTIPVFDSLKHKYGEIYDKDTFELNPKILADYAKLDESTKKIVDNWDEIKAKAKAAQEEMQSNFKSLAGDLGSSLSEALINAFRNGNLDSAIKDFHTKVGDVIADILQQMIFAAAFQASFDKLGADMNASFGLNADGSAMKNSDGSVMTPDQLANLKKANGNKLVDGTIDDDIELFANGLDASFKVYDEASKAADVSLKNRGFENGLGGSTAAAARTASSKGMTSMSQDSADELNGRFTAIQGHTFSISEGVKILQSNSAGILKHLAGIESNTGRLEAIEIGIGSMKESMGAVKQGIDDINIKGITLKK